jgi:hypothetical protein
MRIPGLAFSDLRFGADPGHPADAAELRRQAEALGRFVTSPAHAPAFRLLVPGQRLPAHITYASPPAVESIRCARRISPDGSVLFDLVAEVTQSCTATRHGELVEFLSGCTIVIDPLGDVRYIISKRADSEARAARQHRALAGPLKRYWRKEGTRYVLQPDVLNLLHDPAGAPARPSRVPKARARTRRR